MSRENLIIIGAVALIVAVWIVVRIVMKKAINKTADAIHNARVRAQAQNPPKIENLADRYNDGGQSSEK